MDISVRGHNGPTPPSLVTIIIITVNVGIIIGQIKFPYGKMHFFFFRSPPRGWSRCCLSILVWRRLQWSGSPREMWASWPQPGSSSRNPARGPSCNNMSMVRCFPFQTANKYATSEQRKETNERRNEASKENVPNHRSFMSSGPHNGYKS